jgi:hypothetical protein
MRMSHAMARAIVEVGHEASCRSDCCTSMYFVRSGRHRRSRSNMKARRLLLLLHLLHGLAQRTRLLSPPRILARAPRVVSQVGETVIVRKALEPVPPR